jgi:acyl-coenzyme A thioesterase PaaI-like protein
MPADDASSVLTTEEEIFGALRDRAAGTDLRIPPRCFEEMNAEVQRYDPATKTLRVRIPVEERYENPTGVMQGGFLCAAFDNVLGPLSYLVAPPSATTQLNVTFLRPVMPAHTHVEIEARFEERAGKHLQLSATAWTPNGKTAATCTSTCRILET